MKTLSKKWLSLLLAAIIIITGLPVALADTPTDITTGDTEQSSQPCDHSCGTTEECTGLQETCPHQGHEADACRPAKAPRGPSPMAAFTLTFHYNYRGSSATVDKVFDTGDAVPAISDFPTFGSSKYGVDFAGWNTAPDGTGDWYGSSMFGASFSSTFTSPISDVYAIWKTKLSFNPSGMAGEWYDSRTLEVIDSLPITVPDLSDPLFAGWPHTAGSAVSPAYNPFVGWHKTMYGVNADGTQNLAGRYSADGSYGPSTFTPVGPSRLNAIYAPRVTYSQNYMGGWNYVTVDLPAAYVANYATVSITDPIFSSWSIPSKFTPTGWISNNITYGFGDTLPISRNTSFLATFTSSVTLHRNRSSADTTTTTKDFANNSAVPALTDIGLGGWQLWGTTFQGWNTSPNGTGTWYGGSFGGAPYNATFGNTLPTDLYAIYSATITYSSNGATSGNSYQTVTEEYLTCQPVTVPAFNLPLFTGAGWTYPATVTPMSWNTQRLGQNTSYYPGDIMALTQSTTLYLIMDPHISYSSNGATLSGGSRPYTLFTVPSVPHGAPTAVLDFNTAFPTYTLAPGYTFIGWNTSGAGTGDWYYPGSGDTVSPTHNVTLYAIVGKPITATVTGGGGVYNGTPYGATVSGDTTGLTVRYAPDNSGTPGTYQTTPITRTDAGTTTFYVELSGSGYVTKVYPVTITVTKAPLNIQVNNHGSITKGSALNLTGHGYTVNTAQLKGSDTAAVVVGTPVFSSSYTTGSPAGSYTITVTGLSATNYDLNILPGQVTATGNSGYTPRPPQENMDDDVLSGNTTITPPPTPLDPSPSSQAPRPPASSAPVAPPASSSAAEPEKPESKPEASAPVEISDPETPLEDTPVIAAPTTSLAIVNLVLLGVSLIQAAVMILIHFRGSSNTGRSAFRFVSLPLLAGAALLFFATQDFSAPVVLTDKYTLLMTIAPLGMLICEILARGESYDPESEDI